MRLKTERPADNWENQQWNWENMLKIVNILENVLKINLNDNDEESRKIYIHDFQIYK